MKSVFHGFGCVTESQIAEIDPMSRQVVQHDTVVPVLSNVITGNAYRLQLFVTEQMIVGIEVTKRTVNCLVQVQTLSANQVDDVFWTAGDVMVMLIVKMAATRTQLFAVSIKYFFKF